MSKFKKMTYVIAITLQLVALSACGGPGFKLRTDTELEVPPPYPTQEKIQIAKGVEHELRD